LWLAIPHPATARAGLPRLAQCRRWPAVPADARTHLGDRSEGSAAAKPSGSTVWEVPWLRGEVRRDWTCARWAGSGRPIRLWPAWTPVRWCPPTLRRRDLAGWCAQARTRAPAPTARASPRWSGHRGGRRSGIKTGQGQVAALAW